MSVLLQIDGVDVEVLDDDPRVPKPTPDRPPAVPDVSDRQFFQALANAGKITQDEALAYVGPGTLPKAIDGAIGQLPADEQFAARMEIIGAKTFVRMDPLAAQMGALLSMSSADLDALWLAAALL